VVAAVAAASLACRPAPGLGRLSYVRANVRHVVDLATCGDRTLGPAQGGRPPGGRLPVLDGRFAVTAEDLRSASLSADGLPISIAGHRVGTVLGYGDYFAWCGGRAVFSAGGDRIAGHHKRLEAAAPPGWRPRAVVRAPGRAFGSVACAPGGRAVVVQSERDAGVEMSSTQAHWSLWRVGFDGSMQRLTSPPPGSSDDSPRVGRDGTVFFVRSHGDRGRIYALRGHRMLGPFASLASAGYYGHHAWPYGVSR
jgi:hypothetical protein